MRFQNFSPLLSLQDRRHYCALVERSLIKLAHAKLPLKNSSENNGLCMAYIGTLKKIHQMTTGDIAAAQRKRPTVTVKYLDKLCTLDSSWKLSTLWQSRGTFLWPWFFFGGGVGKVSPSTLRLSERRSERSINESGPVWQGCQVWPFRGPKKTNLTFF